MVCSVNLVSGLSLPVNMKDNKFYGNNGVNADKGSAIQAVQLFHH